MSLEPGPSRPDAIPTLSEGQKTCLRLVSRGMSSKEIARETGLTPLTVDTYLKAALAKLGAANRRDAARALAAWELSRELGSPPADIAGPATVADASPHIGSKASPAWLRLPPMGGGFSDLSWTQKSYQALQVAAVAAAVTIALALALAGLLQTIR